LSDGFYPDEENARQTIASHIFKRHFNFELRTPAPVINAQFFLFYFPAAIEIIFPGTTITFFILSPSR